MKLLITGASGFVGQFLQNSLAEQHTLITIKRGDAEKLSQSVHQHFAYQHADALIHLAGRAHIMHDTAENIYQAYADVNIDYTLKIAALAKQLNVKRFVFVSSIKVNGELSDIPFTELDIPKPEDAYGKTKLAAEIALKNFCDLHEMQLVIIRPPLIYGAGVKANFKSLIQLCEKFLPLPFGAIHNKRSMVYVENLIDFIALCITHPKAANETFLISDDEDISTTTLIRTIRTRLGMPSLLLPIPQSWIVFVLYLIGKKSLSTRVCGNLQVDITKAKTLLGWKPPFTFEQCIKNTIQEK